MRGRRAIFNVRSIVVLILVLCVLCKCLEVKKYKAKSIIQYSYAFGICYLECF